VVIDGGILSPQPQLGCAILGANIDETSVVSNRERMLRVLKAQISMNHLAFFRGN
jgi:hypothetical protein